MSMNFYALRVGEDQIRALRAEPDLAADWAEQATMTGLDQMLAGQPTHTAAETAEQVRAMIAAAERPPGISDADWAAIQSQRAMALGVLDDAARKEAAGNGAPAADGPSDAEAPPQDVLDLHKCWHLLHYALCGEVWEGAPPGNLLLSGEEMGEDWGEDWGYGPPRLQEPKATAAFAKLVGGMTVEGLMGRLDPATLGGLSLYGVSEDESPEELEETLAHYFPQLQQFVKTAADNGEGLLLWLS